MNIGDLSITNFYVGDIQADKICLGAEQVWPNTPPGPDYASMYLTLEITKSGYVCIANSGVTYSVNDGPWTQVPSTTSSEQNMEYALAAYQGDVIRFKGIQATQNAFSSYKANSGHTGQNQAAYNVYGNILSLDYGDDFIGKTGFTTNYRPCYNTFRLYDPTQTHNSGVISAENLILPPTVVEGCYRSMFCCNGSLVKAPALPATTLATGCYFNMFGFCTSLTEAPELPATTLANECYTEMFQSCRNLTSAPELPALTLVSSCYTKMFYDCYSLNYIKCLATNPSSQTGSANPYTSRWVENAGDGTGTFVKHPNATWPSGDSGKPHGWTVQDAVL